MYTKLVTINYVNYIALDYLSETSNEADFHFLAQTEDRDTCLLAIGIQIISQMYSNELVRIIVIFHSCTTSSAFRQNKADNKSK